MDDELVIRQFRRRYSRSVFGLSEINGSIGLETAMNNHPGFGTFAKMHHEFFNALSDDGWRKLDGYEGVSEKILSGEFNHDACTGSVTRLSRWAAGAHVGDTVNGTFKLTHLSADRHFESDPPCLAVCCPHV